MSGVRFPPAAPTFSDILALPPLAEPCWPASGRAAVGRDVEAEEASGVFAQDLGPAFVGQVRHGALDGLGRVGPGAFVVRVVVCPEEIARQIVRLGEPETCRIVLERRKAVAPEIDRR